MLIERCGKDMLNDIKFLLVKHLYNILAAPSNKVISDNKYRLLKN